MSDKNVKITLNLSEVVSIIGIILMIFFFTGEPDLWDALLYKLTDGEIPIPKATE